MQIYLSSIIQAKEYGKRYIRILFFSEKLLIFASLKSCFDSIATQNAEIRTVANSLPPLLKYFAKSLFLNQLSLTDKNLKYIFCPFLLLY